ncbi:uncharacterized protein LOC108033239 [Drosophila biarmipes]|uniref:uncharacterized protein LOC108033239 n=1 Tax=Drosophila biarmipes TaxID=125945 RepID=UPI0007E6633F|nr:uncharacterized protein LOC108033239 [Drosophila biarmipes]
METFELSRLILLVVLSVGFCATSEFEFTNLKCSPLDKEFMDVEACYLKSRNRTYKFLTFRTKFHQVEIFKRLNGYKPFLYNFTVDACQFLNGRRNPLVRFFYELFASYSNLNHSCPYNHDIFVEKVPISFLKYQTTVVLPVPEGDYLLHSVYTIRGKARLDLKVYVKIY